MHLFIPYSTNISIITSSITSLSCATVCFQNISLENTCITNASINSISCTNDSIITVSITNPQWNSDMLIKGRPAGSDFLCNVVYLMLENDFKNVKLTHGTKIGNGW